MESEILSKLAKKGMKLGSTFDGFVFRHPVFSNFFSKTIAFTKFLRKKCERISAISTLWAWKVQKLTLTLYWQKFRENKVFTKKKLLPKELISLNVSLVRVNFSFLHCATLP